jgi:hypothetical protein
MKSLEGQRMKATLLICAVVACQFAGAASSYVKPETVALWFEKQTPECVSEDYSFGARVSKDRQMMSHGGAWSTWGCAYRESGVARVFFVQHAGGESKGYEKFRFLVDKDAETSYSPLKQ